MDTVNIHSIDVKRQKKKRREITFYLEVSGILKFNHIIRIRNQSCTRFLWAQKACFILLWICGRQGSLLPSAHQELSSFRDAFLSSVRVEPGAAQGRCCWGLPDTVWSLSMKETHNSRQAQNNLHTGDFKTAGPVNLVQQMLSAPPKLWTFCLFGRKVTRCLN